MSTTMNPKAIPSQVHTACSILAVSRGSGLDVSGFLGAPALHQSMVKIDYRDNLIYFDYDPKRIRGCSSLVTDVDCESYDPNHVTH